MRPESERQAQRELLEGFGRLLEGTDRRRTPVEAPLALTGAYADYIFAYASARLGDGGTAERACERSRATLADHREDAVHTYLRELFELRIANALAGKPDEPTVPAPLRAVYEAAHRVDRYKIDRLCEFSRILSPVGYPTAIEVFSTRGRGAPVLVTVADGDARQHAIERLLVLASVERGRARVQYLETAFRHAFDLPRPEAKRVLLEALQVCAGVPVSECAALVARALVAADYHADDGLVALLSRELQQMAPLASDMNDVIGRAIPVLRRRGTAHELLAVIPPGPPLDRITWAGAIAHANDAEPRRIFAAAFEQARRCRRPEELYVLLNHVATGLALAPFAVARWGFDRFAPLYASTTDAHGTNSHYCLSVLVDVESLIVAIL